MRGRFLRPFLHGPDIALRADEQRAVGYDGCGVGCGAERDFGKHLLLFASRECDELFVRADKDLAIGDEWCGSNLGLGVLDPEGLAGFVIEAMHASG